MQFNPVLADFEQDLLTGALNERAFVARLQHSLRAAARAGDALAVVMAVIDGRDDESVLIDAARRVRDVMRSNEQVGRTAAWELAVFCPGSSHGQANAVRRRVHETSAQPYQIAGRIVAIPAAVACAVVDPVGEDLDALTLLSQTRTALHER